MAWILKKKKNGKYRFWSTITDSYISKALNRVELMDFWLVDSIKKAYESTPEKIDTLIAEADAIALAEERQRHKDLQKKFLQRAFRKS